eukprot:11851201-Heterocapsa_arctica.AAC.1
MSAETAARSMPSACRAKGQAPTPAPSWAGAWRLASARGRVARSGTRPLCTIGRGRLPMALVHSTALGTCCVGRPRGKRAMRRPSNWYGSSCCSRQ